MPNYTPKDISRFWDKVDKVSVYCEKADSPCWQWTGAVGGFQSKIPTFWDGKSLVNAVKFCYSILNIPIRKYAKFIRLCDNFRCVNPSHVIPDTLENRFWLNVNKSGPINFYTGDRCWEWVGGMESAGYGRTSIKNKTIRPHVASMILAGKTIPDGAHVCHKCGNKVCVRPTHLYIGDAKTNGEDKRMHNYAKSQYT